MFLAQRALLAALPTVPSASAFSVDQQRLRAALAPLQDRLWKARRLAADSHAVRAWQALRPLLPVAAAVLVGGSLVPLAIRLVFFFLLAPAAARLAPIVIGMPSRASAFSMQHLAAPGQDSSRISAVARHLTLAAE